MCPRYVCKRSKCLIASFSVGAYGATLAHGAYPRCRCLCARTVGAAQRAAYVRIYGCVKEPEPLSRGGYPELEQRPAGWDMLEDRNRPLWRGLIQPAS